MQIQHFALPLLAALALYVGESHQLGAICPPKHRTIGHPCKVLNTQACDADNPKQIVWFPGTTTRIPFFLFANIFHSWVAMVSNL